MSFLSSQHDDTILRLIHSRRQTAKRWPACPLFASFALLPITVYLSCAAAQLLLACQWGTTLVKANALDCRLPARLNVAQAVCSTPFRSLDKCAVQCSVYCCFLRAVIRAHTLFLKSLRWRIVNHSAFNVLFPDVYWLLGVSCYGKAN